MALGTGLKNTYEHIKDFEMNYCEDTAQNSIKKQLLFNQTVQVHILALLNT